MSTKIPKQLVKLLKQRKDVAEKLMALDAVVEKMLEDLKITNTFEYVTLQNDYGCMLTTEPGAYYDAVVDFLEKHLNQN